MFTVDHVDARRESVYDCNSSFGRVDPLVRADADAWILMTPKGDSNRIFAFE